MENEVSKGNGKLIGALIFFIALSVALGAFIVYDKFIVKEEVKDVDNKDDNQSSTDDDKKPVEQSSYENFLATEKANRTEKIIESYGDKDDDNFYEIRLTANGDVYATVKASNIDRQDIVNQVLETQVVKYFIVSVGKTDVGDSRELVFIKEDGSISTIYLGMLLIGNEIKVNQKFDSLQNIVEVYDKGFPSASEYEPPDYKVYAKNIDGKETEITDLIEATRNQKN